MTPPPPEWATSRNPAAKPRNKARGESRARAPSLIVTPGLDPGMHLASAMAAEARHDFRRNVRHA